MRRPAYVVVAILLAFLTIMGVDVYAPLNHAPTPVQDTVDNSVVKVVDGDTLDIVRDGKTVRLRLIGLDTPETVDPRKIVQCFGTEASAEAKRLLIGQVVRVETDSSQGEHDVYGRMLAYVYLPDGTLFNKYMIAKGYGHEYTYRLPYRYQSDFKAAEKEAREKKKGLWAEDACAGDTKKAAHEARVHRA